MVAKSSIESEYWTLAQVIPAYKFDLYLQMEQISIWVRVNVVTLGKTQTWRNLKQKGKILSLN